MDAEFSLPETILSMMLSEGFGTDPSVFAKHSPDISFVMKNGTEYEHKGKITRATGVVNASTGTISLKATFPNPKGQLYSGMQGTIVIPIQETDVMVIPQEAVVKLQDKQQVYKVQPDSTARPAIWRCSPPRSRCSAPSSTRLPTCIMVPRPSSRCISPLAEERSDMKDERLNIKD
jgi:multidrug efflux pump subunit AcrA (membrane-fusion protein)